MLTIFCLSIYTHTYTYPKLLSFSLHSMGDYEILWLVGCECSYFFIRYLMTHAKHVSVLFFGILVCQFRVLSVFQFLPYPTIKGNNFLENDSRIIKYIYTHTWNLETRKMRKKTHTCSFLSSLFNFPYSLSTSST